MENNPASRVRHISTQMKHNRLRITELRTENKELGAELLRMQEEQYEAAVTKGEVEYVGVEGEEEDMESMSTSVEEEESEEESNM